MADFDGALTHGGDTRGFLARYGTPPLDFSANVNPLGVPGVVRDALCAAAGEADRYPDPLCRDLRAAIAQSEGLNPEQIFCAAGAAEIIYRLAAALRPKRALIPAPTFSEYAQAVSRQGCGIERHWLQPGQDFALTPAILPQLRAGIALVFLCNPNNPTGRCIDAALLDEILRRCAAHRIRLVVDECFLGFTPQHGARTLVPLLERYPNLLVLKAFTKLYGMAGVRLGYCVGSDLALIGALYEAGPPWNVSSLAQQAGIAALTAADYLDESRAMIAAERPRLHAALSSLGLRVIPSEANYLLFFSSMPLLGQRLCEQGVLIRDCANFEGLCDGWYRVAVRTPLENDRLLAALSRCLLNRPNAT